jgi:hypothetical protein
MLYAITMFVSLCFAFVLFRRTRLRLRAVMECLSSLMEPPAVISELEHGFSGYILMLAPMIDPQCCSGLDRVAARVTSLGHRLIVIDGPRYVALIPKLAVAKEIPYFPSLVAVRNGAPCHKAMPAESGPQLPEYVARYVAKTAKEVQSA